MLLKDMLGKTPEQIEASTYDETNLPIIKVFRDKEGLFGDDSEIGYIIYCDIWNPSTQPLNITIIDSCIINEKEGQRSMDWFLTGYVVDDDVTIQPGTFVRRGEIYLDKYVGKPSPDWKYSITLQSEDTGERYNIFFNRVSEDLWQQIQVDITDPYKSRFKDLVERNIRLEREMGIRLENISFIEEKEYDSLKILCDAYLEDGASLENNVKFKCILYSHNDDIIGMEEKTIFHSSFLGYDCLEFYFTDVEVNRIKKIRIIPV